MDDEDIDSTIIRYGRAVLIVYTHQPLELSDVSVLGDRLQKRQEPGDPHAVSDRSPGTQEKRPRKTTAG